MDRSVGTLIVAVVILLVIIAIAWGWTQRKRAQSDVATPPKPHLGITPVADPVEGSYVSTTKAGHPLERVAVHGLGIRTTGELVITDGE